MLFSAFYNIYNYSPFKMASPERVVRCSKIPQEYANERLDAETITPGWPLSGEIDIEGMSLFPSDGVGPVLLKDVNLTIPAANKVIIIIMMLVIVVVMMIVMKIIIIIIIIMIMTIIIIMIIIIIIMMMVLMTKMIIIIVMMVIIIMIIKMIMIIISVIKL